MKKALQFLIAWVSKIILSLSLFLWSFILVSQLYSWIWTIADRSHDVRANFDDAAANIFVPLICSLFLKLSWDGLTSWRFLQKKYLATYTQHASEGSSK